jgi:hypothetical protein
MYWDSGDSLEVPSAAAGSVATVFSSVAQQDTYRGWVMLAAEGVDWGTAAGGCASAGASAGAGADADAGVDVVSAAAVADTNVAADGAAGTGAAAAAAAAGGAEARSSQHQKQQGARVGGAGEEVPVVGEVLVYGVAVPPAGQVYGWWLDGQELPAAQVVYEAHREVLRLRGLQLQLTGAALLEWRVRQQTTHAAAAVVVTE